VHDHVLELDERINIGEDMIGEVKTMLMYQKNLKISDIKYRLKNKFGQEIEHLEIQNTIKLIKGDKEINEKELMSDLQKIKDYDEKAFVVLNKGIPFVTFIQTKEMMDKYIKFPEVILITVSKMRKNKYGFFIIHFTGIDNEGHPITYGLGFLDIK
jgi:hypothetical protein